jgi:hypothetical protein
VRGEHDDLGGDDSTVGDDLASVAVDLDGAGVLEQRPAGLRSRVGEPEAVLARMELGLAVNPDRRLHRVRQVRLGGHRRVEASPARGFSLALDGRDVFSCLGVGVRRRVLEVAVDLVRGRKVAHLRDRRLVG